MEETKSESLQHRTNLPPAFTCFWKWTHKDLCARVHNLNSWRDLSTPLSKIYFHWYTVYLSPSVCLSDKDTETSCKTCFWHDPQACLSQWGTHPFVEETDRQFKGSSGWHRKGTVNTPQPSQLAAGAFDSPPPHRDPGDRSHYVKCMSITHASGQQRGGGRAPLVVRSLMCEFIKMNHTFSKRLNQFQDKLVFSPRRSLQFNNKVFP